MLLGGRIETSKIFSVAEIESLFKNSSFQIMDSKDFEIVLSLRFFMRWLYSGTWFFFAPNGGWNKIHLKPSPEKKLVEYVLDFSFRPTLILILFYNLIFIFGVLWISKDTYKNAVFASLFITTILLALTSISWFVYRYFVIRKIKKELGC